MYASACSIGQYMWRLQIDTMCLPLLTTLREAFLNLGLAGWTGWSASVWGLLDSASQCWDSQCTPPPWAMCELGIQTQVLTLAQEALYPPSHPSELPASS